MKKRYAPVKLTIANVTVNNNKPSKSQYSFQQLVNDIKDNGDITQSFSENARSVHTLIAYEAAHNLNHYYEYASIFTDNESDALDMVQQAFTKALENPDNFAGYINTNKDPKLIILSNIEEYLEIQSNTLYAVTQSVLENIAPIQQHTKGEIEHLKNIQTQIAKSLSELSDEEAVAAIRYMSDTDNEDLPQFLKDKLLENDELRNLHFNGNTPNKHDM